MNITLYHNPKCSKSRQTLALIQKHHNKIDIIEYLQNPPSHQTIQQWISLSQKSIRSFMRSKDSLYQQLELDNQDIGDEMLIQTMIDNPQLIERPVVMVDNHTVLLGRPPENVLTIFENV